MHALFSIVIVFVLCEMALACAALYLLPVLIGWIRRVPGIGSVAVINVLLGWTLLGWVAALAMALRSSHRAPPAVQVVQYFPQPRPWPGQQARAGWAGPPGPPPPRPGIPPPLTLPPRAQPGTETASPREHQ